jgi:hypothetical protein
MHMSDVTMFSVLFALVGLLFVGISIPLIMGRVPLNSFYGCRTAKTLSNPKIWYEANRISGKDLLIAGVLTFASSLAMLAFGRGMNPNHAAGVHVYDIADLLGHSVAEGETRTTKVTRGYARMVPIRLVEAISLLEKGKRIIAGTPTRHQASA